MEKFINAIEDWEESRKATVSLLRNSAKELKSSYQRNAKSEQECAQMSLTADCIGLAGVVLAPFSGGLSLAAVGVSSVLGLGSFLDKREANKKNENRKRAVESEVEQTIDEDENALEEVKKVEKDFIFFEETLFEMEIDDVLLRIERTEIFNLEVTMKNIREDYQFSQRNACAVSPHVSKYLTTLRAHIDSAEQMVKSIQATKEVFGGTIEQLLSKAKSVNMVTKTAKSLANAKQAAVTAIQSSRFMAKSTASLASVGKVTSIVSKSIGAASSATKSARLAVDFVSSSGKAASVFNTVTNVAKAGTARVSSIFQTAASVSKVGAAVNAVMIPFDIYNLVTASDNLHRTHEDVSRIENVADSLEKDMKKITAELKVKYEHIKELRIQLCKVYEDHRIEVIYEFLEEVKEQFELDEVLF